MDGQLFDEDFFAKLNKLRVGLDMKLQSGQSGLRKSGAKGSSVEFSDYREYIPGDDIRRIDWNAYGRTDRLYIKQFMEEKEGQFNIFIDASRSMSYGSTPKWDMARRLAGALAYVILGNLDRVYIGQMRENSLTMSKGVAGRSSFRGILTELSRMECGGGTSLADSILGRSVRVGGVSVIISDFLDRQGVERAVSYLAYKKQKVVLVHIMAAEETDVNLEGTVNIIDMESGDSVRITMSRASIDAYKRALKAHQQGLRLMAQKYGAVYVALRTDESLEAAMLGGLSGVFTGRQTS